MRASGKPVGSSAAAAPAAATGPTTAWELDWTVLADQLGLTDGAVTIDGVGWTLANQAASSLAQISNGAGLQMTASAGVSKTWTGSTNTAPAIYAALVDLDASLSDYTGDLWIWSHFSAYSCPSANNTVQAGCYAPASTPYTVAHHASGFTNSSGTTYASGIRGVSTPYQNTGVATTHDVLVWRYCAGGGVEVYAGTWAAGWPELVDMEKVIGDVQPEGSTIMQLNGLRRPNAALYYSPATRAATGAPSFTLANSRIQLG